MPKIDPDLKRAMDGSLKAYSKGDPSFFEYVDEKVRVYGPNSTEPVTGKKAFKASFGTSLSEHKRQVKVVAQDVQVSGDQAILSQTLQITANRISSHVRQTVVWAKVDAHWKMLHIHNAFVGKPLSIGPAPTTPAGLRVLNDRIATAAAVVGVAQ